MDFQNLLERLPKYPQTWSIDDVSQWLRFINLEQYILPFQQASVDGSCINLIDQQILEHQLGVKSGIIRKKLINWVQDGLHKYEQFLNHSNKMIDESQELPSLNKTQTSCMRNPIKPLNSFHAPAAQEGQPMDEENQDQLIIQSFEGNNLGTHIVKHNETISIGYAKQNDIQSLETTFQDRHAIIGHNGQNYYVKDLGSKYGTYIKITHRTQLELGNILEIGSFQFELTKMDTKKQTLILKCLMGNLQDENEDSSNANILQTNILKNQLHICLLESNKFTFGRRKQNDFHRNDKHMSGIHCKLIFFNHKFYIEDFGSTNGTWIRISRELRQSKEYPLHHQSIVKIGTTVTYMCQKNKKFPTHNIDIICRVCNQQQNNCLFYPCSHNITCLKCCENLDACPQCGFMIDEKIKIHK